VPPVAGKHTKLGREFIKMKHISLIAAALVLAVALGTAVMAQTPKQHPSKLPKPPRASGAIPNVSPLRQYEEDKRKGWYKADRS
jgi:hypothetical protein